MSGVLAYVYEADHHCEGCAVGRFGADADGWVPADALDREGNPVGALAPWETWWEPALAGRQVLACGTCGAVLDEVEV